MEVTHEVTKLIKYSLRCKAIFQGLKDTRDLAFGHHTTGIRVLPYSKKLWRGKNFSKFGKSQQFTNFLSIFICTCSNMSALKFVGWV